MRQKLPAFLDYPRNGLSLATATVRWGESCGWRAHTSDFARNYTADADDSEVKSCVTSADKGFMAIPELL